MDTEAEISLIYDAIELLKKRYEEEYSLENRRMILVMINRKNVALRRLKQLSETGLTVIPE